MADRPWKAEERRAAALFGGTRFPGNAGGALDFETPGYVGQVKHRRVLSLAQVEMLAVEMEHLGGRRTPPKPGVLVVKRRAGRGQPTPRLIVVTEAVWRGLHGAVPDPDSTPNPEAPTA